jgi:NADPH:quinone reductase-like Zn-dependent oxidoreductase
MSYEWKGLYRLGGAVFVVSSSGSFKARNPMKAIVQDKYGSPEGLRLREVAEPVVGENEVLVRVRAASLHPDVWHAVTGRPYIFRLMGPGLFKPKNPIPGTDMAGVVELAGKNVTRFQPGDEVFGETIAGEWLVNGGAFAEYVAVSQECLALKPGNITFEQAASVPASGVIALRNLPEASQLGEGREVLINGAGGGVGALALQIVKAYGARVTAVDSTNKLRLLRSLGADRVIDYTREDFTRGDRRYDLIFDVPGNQPFSACRRLLTAEGRYVPIGHENYGKSGRRIFGLIPHFFYLIFLSRFEKQLGSGNRSTPSRRGAMAVLRELLEAGKITPIIDSTYPLGEIHEAFRHLVEDELHGKVILTA